MRGFPLVNTLVVLAFFALAWVPLSQLTGGNAGAGTLDQIQQVEPLDPTENVQSAGITLRFFSTHALKQLKVEYLGETVLSHETADQLQELEQKVEGIELAAEGIDFYVDASFTNVAEGQRVALGIEAIPDDLELNPVQITLWGGENESQIGDSAFFQWPELKKEGK